MTLANAGVTRPRYSCDESVEIGRIGGVATTINKICPVQF